MLISADELYMWLAKYSISLESCLHLQYRNRMWRNDMRNTTDQIRWVFYY